MRFAGHLSLSKGEVRVRVDYTNLASHSNSSPLSSPLLKGTGENTTVRVRRILSAMPSQERRSPVRRRAIWRSPLLTPRRQHCLRHLPAHQKDVRRLNLRIELDVILPTAPGVTRVA